jgi:hypothetical protein
VSASLSEASRELAKEGGFDAKVDIDREDLFEREKAEGAKSEGLRSMVQSSDFSPSGAV